MRSGKAFIHEPSKTLTTITRDGDAVHLAANDRGAGKVTASFLTADQAREAAEELMAIADELDAEDKEDAEDAAAAQARIAAGEPTKPAEQVRAELGLDRAEAPTTVEGKTTPPDA